MEEVARGRMGRERVERVPEDRLRVMVVGLGPRDAPELGPASDASGIVLRAEPSA